jgi:hypothetical protein
MPKARTGWPALRAALEAQQPEFLEETFGVDSDYPEGSKAWPT